MTLSTGDKAPDFSLPAAGGETVTLSRLLGQRTVVLFFYPKDDSPGCTIEACSFRDEYSAFADAGAEVVGVSSDSVASHQSFAGKHGLPMKLVSDEGGKVRALYGVRPTLGLFPGRATFIIDRSGTIRHAFVSQLRFKAHVGEALQAVKRLEGEARSAGGAPADGGNPAPS